jgi:hypothetical protein
MAKKKAAAAPSRAPIAIVTADTHLRPSTWVNRRCVHGDAYYAFTQVCDLAIQYQVPIIAAGDLIDKRRNESAVVDFVRAAMDRLQAHQIHFFYIQGQHELQYPVPWLSAIHSWPTWLDAPDTHRPSISLGPAGTAVYGLDWRPADQVDEALASVPTNTGILVMHQVCQEFMGNLTTPELSFAKIPYAQTLVVGDYHVHRTHQSMGATGQQLAVLSPGSTVLQNIAEDPCKQVFVLYDDLTFQSETLLSRPYLRMSLQTEDDLAELVRDWPSALATSQEVSRAHKIPEHIQKPLLEVQYLDNIPDVYYRVTRCIGDTAELFLKEIRTAEAAVEVERAARRDVAGQGLTGCLPLLVSPNEQAELYAVLTRLLEAPSPPEVLAALRLEFGLGV